MEASRQQVIRFVQEYWRNHRSVPPVRLILKNCNMVRSVRHLYDMFPGRIAGLCSLAGIPSPEERLRLTEKARSTRLQEHIGSSEPRLEAKIFEEIEKGTSLPKIVAQIGHSDLVLKSSRTHARLKGASTGGQATPQQLRSILTSVSSSEQLVKRVETSLSALKDGLDRLEGWFMADFVFRECSQCHAQILAPRFLESYLCPRCRAVLGQTYTEYAVKDRDGRIDFLTFPNLSAIVRVGLEGHPDDERTAQLLVDIGKTSETR